MRLLTVIIAGVLLLGLFGSAEAWGCHDPSTSEHKWSNNWDQKFTFTCPKGQAITELHSIFSKCKKDRVFRFACKRNVAASGRCHWSHYVNDFDQILAFKCPLSGFITGVSSEHDNGKEDRRFKFRCCNVDDQYHRHECSYGIHFLNAFQAPIAFKAPRGHFLVGAISYHDNGKEDRQWIFESCKVKLNCDHLQM